MQQLLRDILIDGGVSIISAPLLEQRYRSWQKSVFCARKRQIPAMRDAWFVDYDPSQRSLWLNLRISRDFWGRERKFVLRERVSIWNRGSLTQWENMPGTADAGIWEFSNFERGRKFREIYGANLPFHHPVIARWDGHSAVAIKSMDLTAPTWSDAMMATKQVTAFLNSLQAYDGGVGEPGPLLGEIEHKCLLLIVPDNSPPYLSYGVAAQWRFLARQRGVELDIKQYGRSNRFNKAGLD